MERIEPRQAFRWAIVPVVLWLVYIGIGWTVAPAWCDSPGLFHGVSAAFVIVAAGALFLGWSTLRRVPSQGSDREAAPGFTVDLGVKLGGLFLAGTILAWIIAGVWCG